MAQRQPGAETQVRAERKPGSKSRIAETEAGDPHCEIQKVVHPSAIGHPSWRRNMIFPEAGIESGIRGLHSMPRRHDPVPYGDQVGIVPRLGGLLNVVRRVPSYIRPSTGSDTSYSSGMSNPGGIILHSNTIAGVSPMPVSSYMCSSSWLYHVVSRIGASELQAG